MYESTKTRYVATTLPKAATTLTINSAYESVLPKHQTSQKQQPQQHQQQQIESQQLQNIHNEYRPTYGAYINNTLPRGPYLQYKFNDQQSAYSKRSDNNQKNRQIEQLKHEFMVLPRAKISSLNDPLSSQANNNNNCLNGIQTLGRHYHYTKSPKRSTIDELSSSDYKKNENSKWTEDDNLCNVINQPRNDKASLKTKFKIPNSIESVNYNTLPKKNLRYASNDNFIVKGDYVCNYNHTAATKHDFAKPTDVEKRNTFCQQIQLGHFDMATDLKIFSKKNEPVRLSYASESGRGCVKTANKGNLPINYVTLLDMMNDKENGFSEDEGWAILCQSIQAMQDLFLADTPSTNRLLPLVSLSNLQITSRGRVVFNVIPAGQMNFKNDVTPFSDKSFLSPEFLNSIGKKISFSESDIEKMWIYSLGITLHKAMPSASGVTSTNRTISVSLTKINNDRENDDVTNRKTPVPPSSSATNIINEYEKMVPSLDAVISTMCAPKLSNRASLMYLLDVISDYCRCHLQIKPFSHIVMDLFQSVMHKSDVNRHSSQLLINKKTSNFDNRSDTDSGLSSAHGDREIYSNQNTKKCEKTSLKVFRSSINEQKVFNSDIPYKFNTIGYSTKMEMEEKPLELTKRLQVTRRRDEILKRRNRSRRNTIAGNMLDIQGTDRCQSNKLNWDSNSSRSTNCIDKIGKLEENYFRTKNNECQSTDYSMPELNDIKFSTLPNLKVRRAKPMTNSNENAVNLATFKSEGPEFIANSSLSPRTIDIADTKCQHNKRAVIVLLLNGKSIKITCNSATTTAREIFETIIKCENFVENFFLGICALIGGDFVFLPPDLKIYKVAPEIWYNASKKGCFGENVIFTLFLRTKFFLPTLRGISSLESRHLLYLQLRKSILESHILCNDEELISLGGLALQSEIGDFTESMKHTDYFTISHYLPEGVYQRNKAMAKYLRNSHYSKKGLHSRDAEYNFIRYVQEMREYGLHLFSAIWSTEDGSTYDVYVALSLSGIRIFRRSSTSSQDKLTENSTSSKVEYQRKLYANFEWLEIENLCFSKHILCVVIRKSESLKAKDNNRIKYKFRMDGRKSCFAFHLASEHHRFYMKLRNSFISLKALSDELNFPLDSIGVNGNYRQTEEVSSVDDARLNGVDTNQPNPMESSNKPLKSPESRVGKLKKSMLNDNRLKKLRNKFLKRSKSSAGYKEPICLHPNGQSKEENQNKENESPKVEVKSQNLLLSPNRNRVKMGTRVFSSQFLNKSFDNVSDISRFDGDMEIDNVRVKINGHRQFEKDLSDDGMSLKSTSYSSLYYSEKMLDKFSTTPLPTDAYVIQSNIKSSCDINHFSMFNETVSNSLFDKFNNLSKDNTTGDRIISRITIVKEKLNRNKSNTDFQKGKEKFPLEQIGNNLIDGENCVNKFTLGISIVQGSDNNVYVKDLVQNGPGDKNGIQIGDQILAVNEIPLLNLPYDESLKILQNTGMTVELIVSQIFKKSTTATFNNNRQGKINNTVKNITRTMKNSFKFKKNPTDIGNGKVIAACNVTNINIDSHQNGTNTCDVIKQDCSEELNKSVPISIVRSMPDLPKVVGIIPKNKTSEKGMLPRTMGSSRKYIGPTRYPVTPIRSTGQGNADFHC